MKTTIVPDSYIPAISIEKYRQVTGDNSSKDELVRQRIFCLERLCRGVIKMELRKVHENT